MSISSDPRSPHQAVREAESAAERIVVTYDPAVKFDLGEIRKPTYVIDGLTGEVKTLGLKR